MATPILAGTAPATAITHSGLDIGACSLSGGVVLLAAFAPGDDETPRLAQLLSADAARSLAGQLLAAADVAGRKPADGASA